MWTEYQRKWQNSTQLAKHKSNNQTAIVRGILYDLIQICLDYLMTLSEAKLYSIEWYDDT
jgi:hypothetical protein